MQTLWSRPWPKFRIGVRSTADAWRGVATPACTRGVHGPVLVFSRVSTRVHDGVDRVIQAERRLWRGTHYAYDDGGATSSDSVMADQLAGPWYADATGLGDLVAPERTLAALRTIHDLNVVAFGDGLMGAVNGMRLNGTVDESSEQSAEVWVGTTYALAAFMIGRGLVDEGWETARGAAAVTYERGLWFRTPEAYDRHGNFGASLYLRPLAIWAIEEALRRRRDVAS